jgi:hypothetical protein
VRIEINVLGETVLSRDLLRMSDRAIDLGPVMEDILDSLFESNKRRFDTAGDGEWTPPSDDWRRRKAALGLDPRTEHASLDMRRSLTQRGGDSIAVTTAQGLQMGTTVAHAQYAKKRGNVLVKPSELERRGWVRRVQEFVVSADRSSRDMLAGAI